MRTLVIASQKGSVGKTTLAGHLGVVAEQSGACPLALIDLRSTGFTGILVY
jgi:chromosome partitioning protein